MKIDTMLSGLEGVADQARRLEDLGVDGAFTFEGPHDVFTPLILAATATSSLELLTNVAIAFPRNPIQLAHQAYDLQTISKGRFTLGLGTQIRAQIERRTAASSNGPSPGCASWWAPSGPFSPPGRRASASMSAASSTPSP